MRCALRSLLARGFATHVYDPGLGRDGQAGPRRATLDVYDGRPGALRVYDPGLGRDGHAAARRATRDVYDDKPVVLPLYFCRNCATWQQRQVATLPPSDPRSSHRPTSPAGPTMPHEHLPTTTRGRCEGRVRPWGGGVGPSTRGGVGVGPPARGEVGWVWGRGVWSVGGVGIGEVWIFRGVGK